MTTDADKTPVDGKRPDLIEMVLEKLGEVGADTKLAVTEAREAKGHSQNTYNLQLELNEHVKKLDRRVKVVEATQLWLPVVAIVLSALAFLKAWFFNGPAR